MELKHNLVFGSGSLVSIPLISQDILLGNNVFIFLFKILQA